MNSLAAAFLGAMMMIIGGTLYLLFYRRATRYAIISCLGVPVLFALPWLGLAQAPAGWPYFASALSMPVLAVLLVAGQRSLARTAVYAVNLAALLVFAYAFWLAQYFFSNYMGPPYPVGEWPSAIISQVWVHACLWGVLPADAIFLLAYLYRKLQPHHPMAGGTQGE